MKFSKVRSYREVHSNQFLLQKSKNTSGEESITAPQTAAKIFFQSKKPKLVDRKKKIKIQTLIFKKRIVK